MADEGDGWDWGAFQKLYWNLLVGHARQWLSVYRKLAMDPEDVAQETLRRAFTAIAKLRTKDSPRAWLLHVQKNVIHDLWKKAKRRISYSSLDADQIGLQASTVDLADDWLDPLHWLAPHVQDLPDSAGNLLRTGYKLRCFEDEILADELQRTPGGVRSEKAKIRQALLDSFGWGEWMFTLRAHRYCAGLQKQHDPAPGEEPKPILKPLLSGDLWHEKAVSYASGDHATRETLWLSECRKATFLLDQDPDLGGAERRLIHELVDVALYNWALLGVSDLEERLDRNLRRHGASIHRLSKEYQSYCEQGLMTSGEAATMLQEHGERYLARAEFLIERLCAVRGRTPDRH